VREVLVNKLRRREPVGLGDEEIANVPEKRGRPEIAKLADGSKRPVRSQGGGVGDEGGEVLGQEFPGKAFIPDHELGEEVNRECGHLQVWGVEAPLEKGVPHRESLLLRDLDKEGEVLKSGQGLGFPKPEPSFRRIKGGGRGSSRVGGGGRGSGLGSCASGAF